MNGDGGAAPQSATNNNQISQPLHQIKQALDIVYNPHSSNEDRKQAGAFLENAKNDKEAPLHGYKLASDRGLEAQVRHFGLLLVEQGIRYFWSEYSEAESKAVRDWVLNLAQGVRISDPAFVRNKIAQLWVEVAKRAWASDWLDMDELLVKLWENATQEPNPAQRDLVLFILETLVDDVFNREDPAAGLRNAVLSKACFDIFTPTSVFAKYYPHRVETSVPKCGEEGWLVRLVRLLGEALDAGVNNNLEVRACCQRVLTVLKACMGWSIPRAVAAAGVVEVVGRSLMVENTSIQMLATDCLSALYTRTYFDEDEFEQLVCPMYHTQTLQLLQNIFDWKPVNPHDIDEERYLFLKRFSELIATLGSFLEEKGDALPTGVDAPAFLSLTYLIASHDSFAVSISALNVWSRALRSEYWSCNPAIQNFIPRLLELSTVRLIRYESMIEESNDPCVIYLNEDLDTVPERHAFLGNYRRFCSSIVEYITRKRPFDVFAFIMSNVDSTLNSLYDNQPPFSFDNYKKNSLAYLRLDAKFSVIEAALKGYMRWSDGLHPQQAPIPERLQLEHDMESWCTIVLSRQFEDPMIKRRVIQLMVTFSTTALDKNHDFMLKILEHILLTRPPEYPSNPAYSDALKELMNICTTEIQRLAMKMPDNLMHVYDQLESKIKEIIATENVDDRSKIAFHTFLFTITHRTSNLDHQTRMARLEEYIFPVKQGWSDPDLTNALQTFQGFCSVIGLDSVQEYLISRQVHTISDFSARPLDTEGQALQTALTERFRALPIRMTKAFIAVSTEKLKPGSTAYQVACNLWHDAIPMILPNLLKFLSHAHGFHNPQNWQGLPLELRPVIKKILTDRFWQAGISTGSRDEFYENVSKTKSTMEGLASSIRGAIRMVRESCYSILWCMSRLDTHFYGLDELPGPLAMSLFADAHALSSHQMSILLNMTRYIIDDCPVPYREHFLTPLLASLFTQVDLKVSGEWNELIERGQISQGGEDQLAEEMKEESILRQLTYTAVLIVAGLLDPQRPLDTANNQSQNPQMSQQLSTMAEPGQRTLSSEPTMREFILGSDKVIEPLILFCTHALRMRDSRCCGIIIRVFRSIVPEFVQANRADIREFICREVLMAAVDSLHEDYFVDVQKDLAQLIATICLLYSPFSPTPRNLLLSLPGITETKVDQCFKRLHSSTSTRHQRALLLELLDGLRGIPMSEKGRLPRASKQRAAAEKEKRALQQQQSQKYAEERQRSPDLGGVADMFS